jgi:predicted ATPase
VTFLFTDIEGSTRLWETAPDAMRTALASHEAIVRDAIAAHGGYVFATGGDGFAAAFARAGEGVAAAVEAQAGLAAEKWPDGAAIRVRMGLHTGEVVERGGDYFGTPVNQTARLMDLGHGGQVLCSAVTAGLLGPEWPLVDLGLHRLRDLSAQQRVYQVGEGQFPRLRSLDVVPGNLPTMRTSLVGRSGQVAALAKLVADERLVTLTGVGGVGKTRLALAVAGAAAPSFSDGCWLVELAAIASGDELVRAVAAGLGASLSEREALVRYLSDRQVLIVLDNCEHVLAAAAALVEDILAASSEVVVVPTSREPLGVEGEVVRVVRSLELPEEGAALVDALSTPAVRLFADRAGSASDRFALDDGNLEVVAGICRQLDGIPLAIELAAARVRTMPVGEIAGRLGERFRLLSARRGSVERHRTLQAAVAWSYDLLSEADKEVFRRLAVFPASFDLAAAEAVAGADIAAVLGLVERSLVDYDPVRGRYQLLETLRQFGVDRLAEAAELDIIRERQAAYYLEVAKRYGASQVRDTAAVRALVRELDNLRAAVSWLVDVARWRDLLGLCRAVFDPLHSTIPSEARQWYGCCLAELADLDAQVRVDAMGELAMLEYTCGDYGDDGSWAKSLRLGQELGMAPSPWAWFVKATVQITTGRSEEAATSYEHTAAIAEVRDVKLPAIVAQAMLAVTAAIAADVEGSRAAADSVVTRARRLGDHLTTVHVLNTVVAAYLNLPEPDYAAALQVLEANEADFDAVLPLSRAYLCSDRGYALRGLNRFSAAYHDLHEAVRVADRAGITQTIYTAVDALAAVCARSDNPAACATIHAYNVSHQGSLRIPGPLQDHLDAEIDACLAALDPAIREQAERVAGALDRRGFLRLLDEIGQGIGRDGDAPA